MFRTVKGIKVIRSVEATKQLKDYIIDSSSGEGLRPLGGAVSLLRLRSGPLSEEENNKPEQRDP